MADSKPISQPSRESTPGAQIKALYLAYEAVILGTLAIIAFLFFWEGLTRGWWADLLSTVIGPAADALRIKPIFLSSPSTIAATAFDLYFRSGVMWADLGMSALEFTIAFAIALGIGIPGGLISGRYQMLSYAVEPSLNGLNALPQIALLPLVILWMGVGLAARVFIVTLLMIVPILISSHAAVRTIEPRFLTLARSFGASEGRIFRTIILPSSVPFILAGVRLAIGRGMIGIVVGEVYGSRFGVGAMMNRAGSTFKTAQVFVGVLTLVAAGLILANILKRFERHVRRWRDTSYQA
jgi:NitT/TauT family transport system permease protein